MESAIAPKALASALEKLLGQPAQGNMAFARCFRRDYAEQLIKSNAFEISGWRIVVVSDATDRDTGTISADQALELRELKGAPVFFLVDTVSTGPGIEGIYSAKAEIHGLIDELARHGSDQGSLQEFRARQWTASQIRRTGS